MKKYFFLLLSLLSFSGSFAQLHKRDLPVVYLPPNISVHFVSPEPISFVDISVKDISGDLALPNILRIHAKDSVFQYEDAVVTITGQKFIAQYRVIPCEADRDGAVRTEVAIEPQDMRPLVNPEISLSTPELKASALRLLALKPERPVGKTKAFGVEGRLYHIYTLADYIFLDLGYRNKTKLPYTIDQIRFSIGDKKVTKASTVQSVNVQPVFTLQDIPAFHKHYRNVFVFKKLTFPGNKVFTIELSEKQLSGRVITIKADYKDLLSADTLP